MTKHRPTSPCQRWFPWRRVTEVALTLATLSCGAPPTSGPPRTIVIDDRPKSEQEPLPEPEPEPAEAPEPEGPPAGLPAQCRGASLDLGAIFAGTECDVASAANLVSPQDISLYLSPAPLDMKPGASRTVNLFVNNQTQGWLTVDFAVGCGVDSVFDVRAFKGDNRADFIITCGGLGAACKQRTVRIAFPAGGSARLPRTFEATERKQSGDCKETKRPMDPGAYSLRVYTPFKDLKQQPRYGGGVLRIQ